MAPPRKKKKDLCDSARYFRDNPKARKKKDTISKRINKRPEQRKKRAELGRKNYAADKKGVNRKGRDFDHATGKYEPSKRNRGRRGEGNRKKKK